MILQTNRIFLAIVCSLILAASAMASNYPPSSYFQQVHLVRQGPALFANVGSLTVSADVIGYSASGVLAQSNPDHIDAVITDYCNQNGESTTKTTTIRLGREWHGNGYMSGKIQTYTLLAGACSRNYENHLKVAFLDTNGNWDSRFSQDYDYVPGASNDANVQFYNTMQSGNDVVQAAWDFIVGKLR